MKIRNRLAIVFTLTTAVVMAFVSLAIYYSSATFRERGFINRLNERVKITELLFLEKDKLEPQMYQDIREKFLHTLPNEVEIVESVEELYTATKPSIKSLPDVFIKRLLEEAYASFSENGLQGVGRIYQQEEKRYAVIVVAQDLDGVLYAKDLKRILIFGGLIGLVLVFLAGRLVARQALKPIAKKINKAQSIGASNLHLRLQVYNPQDELGQLAMAFNDLLDRLEKAFETQKNFIKNASHEMRNPLTGIMGEAEVTLEQTRSAEEYQTAIQNIAHEAERLNTLINHFLNLAQADFTDLKSNQSEVRLDELLLEAQNEINQIHPENQLRLDFDELPEHQEQLIINGNRELLKSALVNLMDNACKFSNNQRVDVKLRESNGTLKITITDLGIGIPKEEQPQIWQTMYRGSNARSFKGSGIGLSLAQRIIGLHQGDIVIQSTEGEGTTVVISF